MEDGLDGGLKYLFCWPGDLDCCCFFNLNCWVLRDLCHTLTESKIQPLSTKKKQKKQGRSNFSCVDFGKPWLIRPDGGQ